MSTFAFTLPWGAIAACVLGILAIVFATMMVSGAMIRNDNIVDTLKEEICRLTASFKESECQRSFVLFCPYY